jgi:4-hydroxyphenylpyruvate dioxygenase
MADIFENPLGTCGFDFVEYAAADPTALNALFVGLGFSVVAKHKSKDITMYKQGDIRFFINGEQSGFAAGFTDDHGPCACSMGFRFEDADFAFSEALKRGGVEAASSSDDWCNAKAIEGIGGSRLFFVDKFGDSTIFDDDFVAIEGVDEAANSCGLTYLDHLTHNVAKGNMKKWGDFYENVFNFREIRYFDIEGKLTGLVSRAMTSPCGLIRIPINESQDEVSQIAEYLKEYNGEGIQHIALGTDDIIKTVDGLIAKGIDFQDTSGSYYELLDERVKDHGENTAELEKRKILLDGAPTEGQGLLLQIFTKTVIGPIFFEIIQRKGNEGFGEGNFQALFDSIELDQIRRGVLKDPAAE